MKIALIGITGNVGKVIAAEALSRDHALTGIARDVSKVQPKDLLTLKTGDTGDPEALAKLIADHDVVISSVPFRSTEPNQLIDAVRRSGVKRYLIVGGAGSLEVAPGKLLLDTPHFAELPDWIRTEAAQGKSFLDTLQSVTDLEWTMLSPSALFVGEPGTGKFRLGGNGLLTDADGKSWISYEDFSIALLDEVENPQHVRRRFTVGY